MKTKATVITAFLFLACPLVVNADEQGDMERETLRNNSEWSSVDYNDMQTDTEERERERDVEREKKEKDK